MIGNTYKRAFISYAREDQDFVHTAVKLLRAGGAEVFLDVVDIEFGTKWKEALEIVMSKCERILVFWSARAKASDWVQREWQLAIKLGKRIVPITLDETPLPEELRQFQGILGLKKLLSPHVSEDHLFLKKDNLWPFRQLSIPVALLIGILFLVTYFLETMPEENHSKLLNILLKLDFLLWIISIGLGGFLVFAIPQWLERKKKKDEMEKVGIMLVDLVFQEA